jgi:Mn-dependent DtxR family transcriptional regulator
MLDRLSSTELNATQELVAGRLGVRREGVTEVAGNLQRAGFIRYHRGHVSVLERSGLEVRACECYGLLRKELSRLVPDLRIDQTSTHRLAHAVATRGDDIGGVCNR